MSGGLRPLRGLEHPGSVDDSSFGGTKSETKLGPHRLSGAPKEIPDGVKRVERSPSNGASSHAKHPLHSRDKSSEGRFFTIDVVMSGGLRPLREVSLEHPGGVDDSSFGGAKGETKLGPYVFSGAPKEIPDGAKRVERSPSNGASSHAKHSPHSRDKSSEGRFFTTDVVMSGSLRPLREVSLEHPGGVGDSSFGGAKGETKFGPYGFSGAPKEIPYGAKRVEHSPSNGASSHAKHPLHSRDKSSEGCFFTTDVVMSGGLRPSREVSLEHPGGVDDSSFGGAKGETKLGPYVFSGAPKEVPDGAKRVERSPSYGARSHAKHSLHSRDKPSQKGQETLKHQAKRCY